jgi:hypothetical protein
MARDLPMTRDDCIAKLGYAHIYMHYLHPRWLDSACAKEQKSRVKKLYMEAAVNWHSPSEFWNHFYDTIENEIENMC